MVPATGVELLSRGPMAAYLQCRCYSATNRIIIECVFVVAAATPAVFFNGRLSLNLPCLAVAATAGAGLLSQIAVLLLLLLLLVAEFQSWGV